MSNNLTAAQHESLNRLHSAIGGEMLDGTPLDSPAAKEAMASVLLSTQADEAQQNMSVSMVKRALGLGM